MENISDADPFPVNRHIMFFAPLIAVNMLLLFFVSPVGFYPDEAAHFAYADFMAENGRAPRPDELVSPRDAMLSSLDLAWRGMHIEGDRGMGEDFIVTGAPKGIPREPRPDQYRQTAASYPTAYYRVGAFLMNLLPGRENILVGFSVMRLYSLGLWCATMFIVRRIMSIVFAGSPIWGMLGFALTGFSPAFCAIGVSVNSDILAVLVIAGAVWRCLVLIRSETWRTWNTLAAFSLCLAGMGVKQHLAALLAAFGAAFIIQQKLHPDDRLPRAIWTVGAGIVASVILLAFMTMISIRFTGGQSMESLLNTEGGTVSLFGYLAESLYRFVLSPHIYQSAPEGVTESRMVFPVFSQFWTYFVPGINTRYIMTDWANLFALKLFIWVGLAGFLVRIRKNDVSAEAGFLAAVAVGWFIFTVSTTWLFFDRQTHMQGRYFLYAAPAIMALLAYGAGALPDKASSAVARGMTVFMVFFFEYELLRMFFMVYRR